MELWEIVAAFVLLTMFTIGLGLAADGIAGEIEARRRAG